MREKCGSSFECSGRAKINACEKNLEQRKCFCQCCNFQHVSYHSLKELEENDTIKTFLTVCWNLTWEEAKLYLVYFKLCR